MLCGPDTKDSSPHPITTGAGPCSRPVPSAHTPHPATVGAGPRPRRVPSAHPPTPPLWVQDLALDVCPVPTTPAPP